MHGVNDRRLLLPVSVWLLWLTGLGVLWASETPPAQQAPHTSLTELHRLATNLVQQARSGRADASQFRIQTTLYRETLRQRMLDNPAPPAKDSTQHALLLDMVRMSALLHAAAKCKTGRYIVCPPELMQQLTAQQQRLASALARLPDKP